MEYSVILSVQFKEESKLIEVNSSSSFIQLQESILVMRNSTIIFDGIVKPFKEKTRVVSSAFRKIAKHNILSVFSLRSRHVLTDSKVVVQYYLSRTPL
ncbi:hypothetical protein ACS0TY_014928 [Phlomoides rotata]